MNEVLKLVCARTPEMLGDAACGTVDRAATMVPSKISGTLTSLSHGDRNEFYFCLFS